AVRVVVTGGGTGGHIYPGLAIDAALREDCNARGEEYASIFFGTKRGLEGTIVTKAGVPLELIPSRPLARRLSAQLIATAGANAAGFAVASRALARFRPDVVIASGGYVTFPVVAAARAMRAAHRINPALSLLEENALPGLTNRLLGPLVDEVWTASWTSPAAFKGKAVVTGIPVRAEFKTLLPKQRAREHLEIDSHAHAMVVLVLGGSQGARSINDAVLEMVMSRGVSAPWWIVHICGERDYNAMKARLAEKRPSRFTLLPYLDDPSPAYAAADLVVARAGASTLAELTASGRASLLIPYPYASEDHQSANARFFAESGASRLLHDAELSGDVLFYALSEALVPERVDAMAKCAAALAPADAAAMIVRRVRNLREGNPSAPAEGHRP
ncbi:MAG TPA: UDP-N-acetylglucosamine--N-acetylmuramyl-(pentapeptide) pyrophosphoryl-undecaprenol N-acetylglucosamine transferase, partial [Candidatus Acidoferrales bacterium]|nr:UDP-N-acetylglucosamine--N-acetylmuramyl-(pentapeptide) pyrophosphoryl-undecaprenol N-acetylglucosamine transferase [Candidatus Acidoferrales bacterium]